MDEAYPFATEVDLSELQGFQRYQSDEQTPSQYHFAIQLPEGWETELHAEPRQGKLATFTHPSDPRIAVGVDCVEMPLEISPADALHALFIGQQQDVLTELKDNRPEGTHSRALTLHQEYYSEPPLITRWATVKNQNLLFFVSASCPRDRYAEFAHGLAVACESFSLSAPKPWPLAENLQTFSVDRPGDFCLFYPSSWQVKLHPQSTPQTLAVLLQSPLGAIMEVQTVYRDGFKDDRELCAQYFYKLLQNDIKPEPLQLSTIEPVAGFEQMEQGQSEARIGDIAGTVTITTGTRPDARFLLSLLCPSLQSAPLAWLVGRRAYDLLLTTLRTPDAMVSPNWLQQAVDRARIKQDADSTAPSQNNAGQPA